MRITGTSTLSNNLAPQFTPGLTDPIMVHAAEMLISLWELSFGIS